MMTQLSYDESCPHNLANPGGHLNRKNRNPHSIAGAAALAVFCLAAWSGCKSKPAGITLDNLSGWIYVTPNPVGVGEGCNRYSFIYNSHLTDTAYVDSTRIDTLLYGMSFSVAPRDTVPAVEEDNLTYQSVGTYIHTLTYYTRIGTLVCPPCTVKVQ